MKIRMGRILAIGIPLGILITFVKSYFNIPSDTLWRYYIIFGVSTILITVVIAGVYHYQFGRKLNELIKILLEGKDIERFIEGNKSLLNKTKGRYHKALIHINLCAGYAEKEDYNTAKEVLLRVQEKDLKGINKTIYYISLAYIYFRLHEIQEARTIVEKFDKEFCNLENHKSVGGHVAVVKIFDLIYKDELSEAQTLLISSKAKWADERLEKAWEYLNKIITERKQGVE